MDINRISELTENGVKIMSVEQINPDIIGLEITMKNVMISFEDLVYALPEVYANQNLYVEVKEMYPLLIHEETGNMKIDWEYPLDVSKGFLTAIMLATFMYLHENAKGFRQQVFYNAMKDKLKEAGF